MFERFSRDSIKVFILAQKEARLAKHNFVGTEQILLGLIAERDGIAAQALGAAAINLQNARVAVEKKIGQGSAHVGLEIPFTPRAKRAIERSLIEADAMGESEVKTEHILLALINDDQGVAITVLNNMSVDFAGLRRRVYKLLEQDEG